MCVELSDIGQLFMAGLPGQELDISTKRLIDEFHINNFIYFKRNVESPEQLRKLSADLRQACFENNLPAPLIAIDQEGGTVTRLGPPFTQFPDARDLAGSQDPETALADYAMTCARELLDIGVNMNLAPVLDVCAAGRDLFMERRALGSDPAEVGRLGALIIRQMQSMGVAACGKHFPGLGAATVDPHYKLPRVSSSRANVRSIDIPPFEAAIAAGVAAIMTSHTVYKHIDPDRPATLSAPILSGILRKEMGYHGIIVTDDLEMGAIENEGNLDRAALQALEAGADLLLICHSHDKVINAFEYLHESAKNKTVLLERVKESRERIKQVRQKFARV
jgi:beta-N-acetylhexosaminidase